MEICDITDESGFRSMLNIESQICCECAMKSWPLHIGGLCFDRYMFGNGSSDMFKYGKLFVFDQAIIGFALVYMVEGEKNFILRILPKYQHLLKDTILKIVTAYDTSGDCYIVANCLDVALCRALAESGFQKREEERFQSVINLATYEPAELLWQTETISLLSEQDIPERARYAAIPTKVPVTEEMYREYFRSEYYQQALDYVIRDVATGEIVGFVTWWIDEKSQTALLEPAACLEKYRCRGIMKRSLFHGLNALKQNGIRYAYVGTSIQNEKSQLLYLSVGFQKIGKACRWKRIHVDNF